MNKTLEEWIERYENKTNEWFERDERFELFYLPEKGFVEIMDTGKMVWVNQLCGDFNFWRDFIERLTQKLGYSHAGTLCIRNIKAYLRMAGFIPYKVEETEQGERYFVTDKHTGQKGLASPAGEKTYYVTWEVATNGI